MLIFIFVNSYFRSDDSDDTRVPVFRWESKKKKRNGLFLCIFLLICLKYFAFSQGKRVKNNELVITNSLWCVKYILFKLSTGGGFKSQYFFVEGRVNQFVKSFHKLQI